MTASFDVAATAREAMARTLRSSRHAGTANYTLPTEADVAAAESKAVRWWVGDPGDADAEALADWQDETAERRHLHDEPSDPLEREPMNGCPYWAGGV